MCPYQKRGTLKSVNYELFAVIFWIKYFAFYSAVSELQFDWSSWCTTTEQVHYSEYYV